MHLENPAELDRHLLRTSMPLTARPVTTRTRQPHGLECFTSIHSRIRVFVRTTKSILTFVRVCLYNTREYPTNIQVFDIHEYSYSNEYKYSIFASIGRVFGLRLSPQVSDILDCCIKE